MSAGCAHTPSAKSQKSDSQSLLSKQSSPSSSGFAHVGATPKSMSLQKPLSHSTSAKQSSPLSFKTMASHSSPLQNVPGSQRPSEPSSVQSSPSLAGERH